MAAHQAPPSLGFSWQEHWSGLPFPSPMHECEKWKWSRLVLSDPQRPHGLQPTRLLRPWDCPGKSTGVGCHCLLRNIFNLYQNVHMLVKSLFIYCKYVMVCSDHGYSLHREVTLTTFQFKGTILSVKRKPAEIHKAHCWNSYPIGRIRKRKLQVISPHGQISNVA